MSMSKLVWMKSIWIWIRFMICHDKISTDKWICDSWIRYLIIRQTSVWGCNHWQYTCDHSWRLCYSQIVLQITLSISRCMKIDCFQSDIKTVLSTNLNTDVGSPNESLLENHQIMVRKFKMSYKNSSEIQLFYNVFLVQAYFNSFAN